ncbi:MAG: uracil-DNA glycosylase [Campylobacteraceae bacterium]|nr:uracil-DNA glycosylase [Campylobacteraceae bacterium]
MTWNEIIKNEEKKDYFNKLQKEIDLKYKNSVVFPNKDKIYAAFDYTAFEDVKVVILGQDPYHGANQAHGLSFSTPKDIKNPPSMKNILKEIEDDMKRVSICEDGDLIPWAKDGVLLLNTILTVEESKPKSHHKLGWETFTANIIKTISEELEGVVFILWGANAIKQEKLINTDVHHILKGVHPSPLSSYRGFFGSKVFSKTNELLKKEGKKEISW